MSAPSAPASSRLAGRSVLITGGGGGIGSRLSVRCAAEGAAVLLIDKDAEAAQAVVREIRAAGGTAEAQLADLTDAAAVGEAVAAALAMTGRVDVLVNNAGGVRDARVQNMSEEDWDAVIDLNLKAAFLCCRAVVPPMIEQKYGRIVNIASMSYRGNFGQANYASAKAGLVGLTQALGFELAPRGITVNCVSPGLIRTASTAAMPPEVIEKISATIPMRRAGHPDDIAEAVLYFASEGAGFVTRQVLHVSGGHESF